MKDSRRGKRSRKKKKKEKKKGLPTPDPHVDWGNGKKAIVYSTKKGKKGTTREKGNDTGKRLRKKKEKEKEQKERIEYS